VTQFSHVNLSWLNVILPKVGSYFQVAYTSLYQKNGLYTPHHLLTVQSALQGMVQAFHTVVGSNSVQFNQYLLMDYMSGTVLGAEDTNVTKTDSYP